MDADEKINNFEDFMKGNNKKPNGAANKKPPTPQETELALAFVAEHKDGWRHVAEWNQWFVWHENRWRLEKMRLVAHYARLTSLKHNGPGKFRTIQAIERIAASEPEIAASIEQWDADPWQCNTPLGNVFLKKGSRHQANPLDYCTKLTAVGPGGKCDRFLAFLTEIFDGNEDLINYMQKVFGYCLTGSVEEQAMWFFYGTGANGKSVLLSTIAGILGDYATTASIETFTQAQGNQHLTHIACLMGARLVTANETEEGRRWAEAKIKQLTGGDKVRANFMRQNTFEFTPQFKLIVAGNHKPALRTVDEAIRRRFNLIPFSTTIPPERRDPQLADKLKAEWPGILQWMIDGCLAWQREGLAPPKCVKEATNAYLADEDATAQWVEDRCSERLSARTTRSELYKSWKEWAELNGEYVGSQKQFVQKMLGRGYTEYRTNAARGFAGIEVN